jgi:hypothetical protein
MASIRKLICGTLDRIADHPWLLRPSTGVWFISPSRLSF